MLCINLLLKPFSTIITLTFYFPLPFLLSNLLPFPSFFLLPTSKNSTSSNLIFKDGNWLNPPLLSWSFMKTPITSNFSPLDLSPLINNSTSLASPLPLTLSNFHFFSNKSPLLLLFNPSLQNFMLFGTSPRIFPLISISFSNSLLSPFSIIFRILVLPPSSILHLGTLLSLPHFFRILFLNGLPPFLKAPKTPPCGALNVVLILLVTSLSLDMFNFGSIFTTNTKKPMNSLLSPSFFYRGTLLELFLQLRTFSFVRSIILPLLNQ